MCTYCGCQAEPVIDMLMQEHTDIAVLVRRIGEALDQGESRRAAELTAVLADIFGRHAEREEAGLFHQLQQSDEALDVVEFLRAEHVRLRAGLSDPDGVAAPDRLRHLLLELLRHAEVEDTDLFPFAIQVLPNESWSRIDENIDQGIGEGTEKSTEKGTEEG